MKKLFTSFVVFSYVSLLCQAQVKDDQPTVHKSKVGTISAVEFSGSEKNIPSSAKAFFEKFLETKPNDRFKNSTICP